MRLEEYAKYDGVLMHWSFSSDSRFDRFTTAERILGKNEVQN